MSFQFLGLSTFQILAVMAEVPPDLHGMVDILQFASVAAAMIYTMVDLSAQNLRVAAVEHLAATEGVNNLRGISTDEVKSMLHEAFQQLDESGTGTLSIYQVRDALATLSGQSKLQLDEKDMNAIMTAIGKNPGMAKLAYQSASYGRAPC